MDIIIQRVIRLLYMFTQRVGNNFRPCDGHFRTLDLRRIVIKKKARHLAAEEGGLDAGGGREQAKATAISHA